MLKTYATVLFVISLQFLYAQTLNDSVFNNVIKIEETDVTKGGSGGDYLVDIPFTISAAPLVLFNNVAFLPNDMFFKAQNFLPNQNEIILIAPDREYYKNVAKSAKDAGLACAKPVAALKLYSIKRISYTKAVIDSISVFQDLPQLHFKSPDAETVKTIKVYLKDCYGSTCCPHDIKRDIREQISVDIQGFIKTHAVKTNKSIMYIATTGKEGEHCYYYTLMGFTNLQKLDFIYEMEYITLVNKATKDISHVSKIYSPFLIELNERVKKIGE